MENAAISASEVEELLCWGGDERLLVDPSSGVHIYGCPAGAFAHPSELIGDWKEMDVNDVIDEKMEDLRGELFTSLCIDPVDADTVFVPSRTDATLQAVFLSRWYLSNPSTILTNVILAVDQAASRVVSTWRNWCEEKNWNFGIVLSGMSEWKRDWRTALIADWWWWRSTFSSSSNGYFQTGSSHSHSCFSSTHGKRTWQRKTDRSHWCLAISHRFPIQWCSHRSFFFNCSFFTLLARKSRTMPSMDSSHLWTSTISPSSSTMARRIHSSSWEDHWICTLQCALTLRTFEQTEEKRILRWLWWRIPSSNSFPFPHSSSRSKQIIFRWENIERDLSETARNNS